MNFNRTFLFWVLVTYILIIISGLPVPILWNAAKYAQISKEILVNNDWINLSIAGDAYDQKPPLLFWIGAVSFKLFGISTYSFKIPIIVLSLIGVYSTFKLGQLLYNKDIGILASIFTAVCIGYLNYHNDIKTDTLLASTVIFSVWMLALYFNTKKWYYFLIGFIGIGLAMLTKGPVGLVIPIFAIGSDLILKKKINEIFHIRWIIGVIVIFIIIIPALIGLLNQFGYQGIKFYFWTNNMGRITGSYKGENIDPTYYIKNSFYVLAPWTFFSFAGIIMEIIHLFKNYTKKPTEMINLGAILLYLSILSVAKAKFPHYMLAIVPFISILTAKWSLEIFSNLKYSRIKKILVILNKIMTVMLLFFGCIFPFYVFPEDRINIWIILFILFSGCSYYLLTKSSLKKQILMLVFSSTFLMFIINVNILPNMLKYQTSISASHDFNIAASANETLNSYKPRAGKYELFFYAKNPGRLLETQDDLRRFLPGSGAWLYTDQEGYQEITKMNLNMTVMKTYTKHSSGTKKSFKFLNPKTRKHCLVNMYLIRLD